jgi:hypothetical protein
MPSGFLYRERRKRTAATCITGVVSTPDYSQLSSIPELRGKIKRVARKQP